jgi:F like protein
VTPDDKLFDDVLSNALDILRLSANERAEVIRRLQAMEKELITRLASEDLAATDRAQINRVLSSADEIISRAYGGIQGQLDFASLGEAVSAETIKSIEVVLGIQAAKLPLADYFNAIASDVMIQGAPSAAWWSAQDAQLRMRFAQQVRQGLSSNETTQQIVSRIVGKNGQPGIMEVTRRNATALVNSSVQAVANSARLATFKANSDVIIGVKQVSTLDSHTSQICIAYSGAEWDLDGNPLKGAPAFNGGPPRHFNCRSVLVPLTKSFKDLGLNIDEMPSSTRASDEGQIDAKTDFDAFLKRKGVAFQDEVLGEGKADLWRAGKITLRDLVSGDGTPLTLAQLRAKAGLA